MKTIAIFFQLFLIGIVALAADEKTANYIIVGDETFYCDKIYVGRNSTRLYMGGNQLIKLPTDVIDSYSANGHVYDKMPVITKKQDTAGWAFMQLLATKGEYKLYKFCSNCVHYDPSADVIAPASPVYRYYVFRNGKYVTVTDDTNAKSVLRHFGVRMIG